MGMIRQFFGYVWFISGGTITFLRLLQLLEVRPDEALNNLGGGFGSFVLAVANVFGDALNGIATWVAGQITGETPPPPCPEPCTEESIGLLMSEELRTTLFYSQYGTLAVVTILFLLIFFILIRR